jgi:predicted O-methyltransferase YrrM
MEHYYKNIQGWFEWSSVYTNAVAEFDNARFVEIGCWKGRSTSFLGVEILNSGKKISLDVVDTFKGSPEHGRIDENALYSEFIKNVEPVRSAIQTIHRLPSIEASKLYDNESVDFVFIDASHEYNSVLADIKAWYPKVKVGGTIAGDDYIAGWPGVIRAVDEFFGKDKIKVPDHQHWYIKKSI